MNIDDGAMLKIRWKIFKRSINDGKILENGKEISGRSSVASLIIKKKIAERSAKYAGELKKDRKV